MYEVVFQRISEVVFQRGEFGVWWRFSVRQIIDN